jgi:hypothetical protein
MNDEASLSVLNGIDRLFLEGREALFNGLADKHTDRWDPQLGWVVLVALGSFKGGYLYLPKVGLRVRFGPGDVILLRGRVIQHMIEVSDGGQRISIPHFTHTSLWDTFGLKDEVSI